MYQSGIDWWLIKEWSNIDQILIEVVEWSSGRVVEWSNIDQKLIEVVEWSNGRVVEN